MGNSIIHLYKASAGAGKTYTLAKEFIKLLIEEPFSYKRILAVTFTNKATEEMQSRIVKNLYSIANDLSDTEDMVEDIIKEWNQEWAKECEADDKSIKRRWKFISNAEKHECIKRNAKLALFLILHDYNHFQISTIDSFFQIILRNLAKELGLGAYLNIIIDESEPLDDSIKLLINDLRTNSDLKNWLNDFSQEKSDSNKSWKIDQDIAQFGRSIFNDIFKQNQKELNEKLSNRKYLITFKDELNKKLAIERDKIRIIVADINRTISVAGYTVDDFAYKESGAYSFVKQFMKADQNPSDYAYCKSLENCSRAHTCVRIDPDKWAGKGNKHNLIVHFAETELNPRFEKLEKQRALSLPHIITCQLILEHIYEIGIINTLATQIRNLNESRNQFLLSDTPTLLNDMISDGDAPFIYEKIGTSLEHIMIDEFQDTSLTQWNNFKPLVAECLAQGESNLIVGDAKQSIYRFRNGDWRIIEGLKEEKGFGNGTVNSVNLEKNWRSEWEVVNFNNSIFSPQCNDLGEILDPASCSPVLEPLTNEYGSHKLFNGLCAVYQSAFQQCTLTDPKEGYVSIEFQETPKKNEDNQTTGNSQILEKLLKKVEEIQDKGIPAKDIAILTRKGKEIEEVADYFSRYKNSHPDSPYNHTIISNEAFKLESSKALQMIIDAMRVIVTPDDPIAMTQVYVNYRKESLSESLGSIDYRNDQAYIQLKEQILIARNLPLYELVEHLCKILRISEIKDQDSYIFYFFDAVNDYIKRKSPDVARFVEYWDKTLKNKSIPFSDNVDGIKIMTIHKSKGLEFKTVLIPFCNWNLYGENTNNKASLLWCSTKDVKAPYNMLPIVPIKFGSKMGNSLFIEEYTEERIQLLADAINLLYVAFTRAKENLIIFAEKPEKDDYKITNCSDLLFSLFNASLDKNGQYTSGILKKIEKKKKEKKKEEPMNPFAPKIETCDVTYHPHTPKAKFKRSKKASEFIGVTKPSKAIEYGLLLHYLFSMIRTEKDITTAVDQLIEEGYTSSGNREKLTSLATQKIHEHPEWFREDLILHNERDIIYRDEKGIVTTGRPDRVVQDGEKMIVIDFKTGRHDDEHNKQINNYVDQLQKMNPDLHVEGHLWYFKD